MGRIINFTSRKEIDKSYAPYPALAIANYFLDKSFDINPIKLQRLIYFSHGWNLAITDEPLIQEDMEAWIYAPVIKVIYDEFSKYGNNPITKKANWLSHKGNELYSSEYKIPQSDKKTIKILDEVWDVYGGLTATQLSNMTHYTDSPWTKIYEKYKDNKNLLFWSEKMLNENIKEYFQNILIE